MANTFRQGAGSLTADFDEARIAGDLIQSGQGALRFGQKLVVQIGFELQESIVNAETVVLHAALEQRDQLLLASQSLEDLHQLRGG